MSTVFRSSVYMQERLGVYGRNHSSKIRSIYILTLYKVYLSALIKGAIPGHENAKKELNLGIKVVYDEFMTIIKEHNSIITREEVLAMTDDKDVKKYLERMSSRKERKNPSR